MSRSWEELVAEGRELVQQETDIKWSLGDLALEVAPAQEGWRESDDRLRRFADDIGYQYDSIRKYRQVAAAWPFGTRVPNVAWSVHREFARRDDRFELIQSRDDWTYREAVRAVGRPQADDVSRVTIEDKRQQLLRLIQDTGLLSDPDIRQAVLDALDTNRETRSSGSSGSTRRDKFALVSEFRDLHVTVDRIARHVVEGQAVVSDDERDALLEEVRWLRTALDHIESGLTAGSLDKALAALLEG